jgi:pimeloyl-ACP methyl ester carboxylesterase
LIVWGREDVLVPPVYGEAFKKAISKSRLIRIAKAGHAVGQEKPAAVLKAIQDFF